MYVCLSVCLSICLHKCSFVCLSVRMYVCMPVSQSVCLSVCSNKPLKNWSINIFKLSSHADSHFNIPTGVVEYSDLERVTIADIPGLVDGASENKGLGHDFLRHIERTKVRKREKRRKEEKRGEERRWYYGEHVVGKGWVCMEVVIEVKGRGGRKWKNRKFERARVSREERREKEKITRWEVRRRYGEWKYGESRGWQRWRGRRDEKWVRRIMEVERDGMWYEGEELERHR